MKEIYLNIALLVIAVALIISMIYGIMQSDRQRKCWHYITACQPPGTNRDYWSSQRMYFYTNEVLTPEIIECALTNNGYTNHVLLSIGDLK